jgi:PAT family beta-lactamase induction signal transducer AmpG
MAFGRTVLASASGFMAASFGWAGFFILTTGLALPALLLLLWLWRVDREPLEAVRQQAN